MCQDAYVFSIGLNFRALCDHCLTGPPNLPNAAARNLLYHNRGMRRDNCEAITIRQQLTQCPYEGGQQWWMQICLGSSKSTNVLSSTSSTSLVSVSRTILCPELSDRKTSRPLTSAAPLSCKNSASLICHSLNTGSVFNSSRQAARRVARAPIRHTRKLFTNSSANDSRDLGAFWIDPASWFCCFNPMYAYLTLEFGRLPVTTGLN